MPVLKHHNELIDDHQLHYVSSGEENNPMLVFIHGTPRNWTFFRRYLADPGLAMKFYLIAIHRPGLGKSDPGKTIHIPEQARLIAKLLDHISKDRPVCVIGHSFGGPVAVALTALRPVMITGLVIIGGTLNPVTEKPGSWRKLFIHTPLKYLLPKPLRQANEEIWFLKDDLTGLLQDYAKILCPVWLVHGKKDGLVSWHNAEWAKPKLINAKSIKIMLLENAGHFIPWTHFKVIKNFLLNNLTTAHS